MGGTGEAARNRRSISPKNLRYSKFQSISLGSEVSHPHQHSGSFLTHFASHDHRRWYLGPGMRAGSRLELFVDDPISALFQGLYFGRRGTSTPHSPFQLSTWPCRVTPYYPTSSKLTVPIRSKSPTMFSPLPVSDLLMHLDVFRTAITVCAASTPHSVVALTFVALRMISSELLQARFHIGIALDMQKQLIARTSSVFRLRRAIKL